MSLRIFNNISSQYAQNRLSSHNDNLGKAIITVASGERVKNSSDDGESLAISESLRSDARSFRQVARNLQDGPSLINNIAESGARARVDATQNRLTRDIQSLAANIENLTAAASTIRDADVAEKVTELTKQLLLVQTSSAMVGQSNLIPEGVQLLLQ
jgi:flagellin-like hook-associated protein FlgL